MSRENGRKKSQSADLSQQVTVWDLEKKIGDEVFLNNGLFRGLGDLLTKFKCTGRLDDYPDYVTELYQRVRQEVYNAKQRALRYGIGLESSEVDYFYQCVHKVRDIYREVVFRYCQETGYYIGNIDPLINNVIGSDCVIEQPIDSFFESMKKTIDEKYRSTQEHLKAFVDSVITGKIEKSIYSSRKKDLADISEQLSEIKEHIFAIYGQYVTFNEDKTFDVIKECLESNYDVIVQEHSASKYNAVAIITDRLNQKYRKMYGSYPFKKGIKAIFDKADDVYASPDIYYGIVSAQKVEEDICSEVDKYLEPFTQRYNMLVNLVEKYPWVTKERLAVLVDNLVPYGFYYFDEAYGKLAATLKDENHLEGQRDCTPRLISPKKTAQTKSDSFLVYCGDTFSSDIIKKKMQSFVPESSTINCETIGDKMFFKITEKNDSYLMDPYVTDYEHFGLPVVMVSGYDQSEIEQAHKDCPESTLMIGPKKVHHRIIYHLYDNYGIDALNLLEPYMSLSTVIYDTRYDQLIIGVCGEANESTHMYVGKVNDEDGYMCSNNSALLSGFCEHIYELQPNTHIINGVVGDNKQDAKIFLKRY